MLINKLWLANFRNYDQLEIELSDGLTAILGNNGSGKTNLVESLGLLSTLKSFRGSTNESLVRQRHNVDEDFGNSPGSGFVNPPNQDLNAPLPSAIVRALGIRDSREVLIELEVGKGRARAQVNKQKLKRASDLLGALRTTIFSPEDLALIKGGPSGRREYLDQLLLAVEPNNKAVLADFERILKQRNALLKSARGRKTPDVVSTLDVWDMKLVATGNELVRLRTALIEQLAPLVEQCYERLAQSRAGIGFDYLKSWPELTLEASLEVSRERCLARGLTTVGPQRDDLSIRLNSLASRNESSQGEQRTLALALRLAGHELVTNVIGESPLLLLDDVLSELDPKRAAALLTTLPPGQTVITSASELPPQVVPQTTLLISRSGSTACLSLASD